MNQRLLTVFAFALAVAGAASFFVYRYVAMHVASAAPAAPTTRILVAARDLEVGALIHDTDLSQTAWGGPVPAQAVIKAEDAIGRGVTTKIFKDEPLLTGRLAGKGAGAGMAATIPIGMRAVALRVNDVVGLAGFVLPGMRVDVLVAGNLPNSDANRLGTLSRTVLQNIEVLSAGQKIERSVDGKPEDAQVVNLLVTPDQAEILSLASSETKVQLVLRNPLDTKEQATHGASVASMFGVTRASDVPTRLLATRPRAFGLVLPSARATVAVNKPAAVPSASVEVFSGVKRVEQKFEVRAENR